MITLFSSPGAMTFSIVVFVLQIISITFMVVLLFNFSRLHRRRTEILSTYETPFISVRTWRYNAFFTLYILFTAILTTVSTVIFFSLLDLL